MRQKNIYISSLPCFGVFRLPGGAPVAEINQEPGYSTKAFTLIALTELLPVKLADISIADYPRVVPNRQTLMPTCDVVPTGAVP